LFANLVDRLADAHVHRMRDHVVVGVAPGELGGLAAPREDAEGGDAG
jgi:hypothetical protein